MSRTIMSVFNPRVRGEEPVGVTPIPVGPAENSEPPQSVEPLQGVAGRPAIKLGKTLVFKGELSVGEDCLLLGRVEGAFTHSESLIVGIGGVIVGDVRGRSITIKGTVEGDIEATESVVVIPSAVVTGNITAPRINIFEGAQLNGTVKMLAPAVTDSQDVPGLVEKGMLTETAVDQLLSLLNARRKA
ncbi:MAG: polymer-forming cytoskeletal protein [Steroidobacteraceae bacterium]